MRFIDSHCHLTDAKFDMDRDEVIKQSMEKLRAVITVGISPKDNEQALNLAEKYKGFVFAALGCFPTACYGPDTVEKVLGQIRKSDCVAVGEVGLDFHWEANPNKRGIQRRVFKEFIDFAREQNKPLVVHTRKAMQETLELLEKDPPKNVIIHCFSGNASDARRCQENGFFLSLGTNYIYSGKSLINKLELNSILVETDSPYLWKGSRNEPIHVVELVSSIAAVKELSVEQCADVIYNNILRAYPGILSGR